jgi:hypothetical protein
MLLPTALRKVERFLVICQPAWSGQWFNSLSA